MILEKLVKQGKALAAGLAFALAASGCIYIDARKSDSEPIYPATQVQASFGNGLSGKVNYEICGEIPFNQISYTINGVPSTVSFNDAEMVDKENSRCFYRESDIIDGENSVTAVADENPNPEENGSYKFTPATEEESDTLLIQTINNRIPSPDLFSDHGSPIPGVNIQSCGAEFPNPRDIDSDYLLRANPTFPSAVINYISFNNEHQLQEELDANTHLDCLEATFPNAYPHFYARGIPSDELSIKFNQFLDSYLFSK